MGLYATLAELKAVMNSDAVAQDAKLLSALRVASRRVDMEMGSKRAYFEPVLEVRAVPVRATTTAQYGRNLRLPFPLLAYTSAVVFGSQTPTEQTAISNGAIYPYGAAPAWELTITGASNGWYIAPDTFALITGVWGYHRDYANAWVSVDTLAAAIVSTTATSLTVADVDGVDEYGQTPRLSTGNLIKVDSEYLEITATNTTTNVVTVRRGQNGSTAATHLIAAPVSVWRPEDMIRRAVARQAGLMVARQGAYTTVSVEATGTEVRYPVDLLVELRAALQEFSYGV